MKFIISIFFIILPTISFSKTVVIQSIGYIKSVEVLKKYVTQNIPKKEKICEIKRVPVQKTSRGFGADNLIGALIGGAIGNKLGEGGGKSGSTAIGALIGSEIVSKDKQARADNDRFVEKEVCRIQNITYTETSEQITGYKLSVDVDGQIIQFRSNKSYNPGDSITIRKEIRYFLD
tara:strand:- start:422 stop:949 length:528 start_codon:yes stop_codon:yes gene_type:complete